MTGNRGWNDGEQKKDNPDPRLVVHMNPHRPGCPLLMTLGLYVLFTLVLVAVPLLAAP